MAILVHPQLDGPHEAELTTSDVRQIIELSYSRSDIRQPIYRIYMEAPDQADVSGGRPQNTGDPVTGFKVRKRDGHWTIVPGSVYQTEVIITS
jgi:hypothetical protein